MLKTPSSNRHHIALFGATNAGKSALANALAGSEISIVSSVSGTTTDPVRKAVELIGFGPVVFIDTAGLNDRTDLGVLRTKRTYQILDQSDFALYLIEASASAEETDAAFSEFSSFKKRLEKKEIPYLLVFSKQDLLSSGETASLLARYPEAMTVSTSDVASVDALRARLIAELSQHTRKEQGLLDGLLDYGDDLVLVVPVDSEAPAGRLILPQVQTIRAALDLGVRVHLTSEIQVADLIVRLPKVDLVITDSQAFREVAAFIPETLPLSSFSILMARQKAPYSFETLIQGAFAIDRLRSGDRVLIAEACSHNTSHEDIGTVKIPRALEKRCGCKLEFTHVMSRDFPEDVKDFALVVHCGSCMLTGRETESRLEHAISVGVPITNYGLALAHCSGILGRSVEALGYRLA